MPTVKSPSNRLCIIHLHQVEEIPPQPNPETLNAKPKTKNVLLSTQKISADHYNHQRKFFSFESDVPYQKNFDH